MKFFWVGIQLRIEALPEEEAELRMAKLFPACASIIARVAENGQQLAGLHAGDTTSSAEGTRGTFSWDFGCIGILFLYTHPQSCSEILRALCSISVAPNSSVAFLPHEWSTEALRGVPSPLHSS